MRPGGGNRLVHFEELIQVEDHPDPASDPLLSEDPLLAPDGDPLGDARIWVRRFSRYMDLTPELLRETAQGDALIASGRWRGEARRDPETAAVRPEDWRIRTGEDQIFNIRGVADPDGRRRLLVFVFEEGVAT